MTDATFRKGDVVVLKSGGPHMTIVKVYYDIGDKYAVCTWMNRQRVQKDTFPIECVVPAYAESGT